MAAIAGTAPARLSAPHGKRTSLQARLYDTIHTRRQFRAMRSTTSARFLKRLRALLENPLGLLLRGSAVR
ncbi:MAG: hypothetical protein J7551_04425 [Chloroflexi bacterium]|nr:hypothetical protein [Chloroflexota bacterium]